MELTAVEKMEEYFYHKSYYPIKIDKNNFNQKFAEYFSEDKINRSIKNITYIIGRVDEIIKITDMTYQHIKHIDLDDYELLILRKKIDKYLEESDSIGSRKLFKNHIEDYKSNLLDHQQMYSILKYFFKEDYKFTSDSTMRIYAKDYQSLHRKTIQIRDYSHQIYTMVKNYGPISLESLVDEIDDKSKYIEASINKHRELVLINNKAMLGENLFISEEEKNKIKKVINDEFKKGYSSTSIIFNRLSFDLDCIGFIKRNQIKDGKDIASIARYIHSFIRGNRYFLYDNSFNISGIYDVVKHIYRSELNIKDIEDLVYDLELPKRYVKTIMKIIEKERDFMKITRDSYLHESYYEIEDELIGEIEAIVLNNYKDSIFISPKKILNENHIRQSLSLYPINEFLISNVLDKLGYIKLDRYNPLKFQDIFVKRDYSFTRIDELVHYLLKNEYDNNRYEAYVYDYLVSNYIYEEDTSKNKKLGFDILRNGLVSVDYSGRVSLKGE